MVFPELRPGGTGQQGRLPRLPNGGSRIASRIGLYER